MVKIRNGLSINSDDVEPISIEILFNNRRNTFFNVLHRQHKGQMESFENIITNKRFR